MNTEESAILERIKERDMQHRLERAAQWTPEMLVAFQDVFLTDRQNSLVARGTPYEAAKIMVRQNFDIWEHNSLNAYGRAAHKDSISDPQ